MEPLNIQRASNIFNVLLKEYYYNYQLHILGNWEINVIKKYFEKKKDLMIYPSNRQNNQYNNAQNAFNEFLTSFPSSIDESYKNTAKIILPLENLLKYTDCIVDLLKTTSYKYDPFEEYSSLQKFATGIGQRISPLDDHIECLLNISVNIRRLFVYWCYNYESSKDTINEYYNMMSKYAHISLMTIDETGERNLLQQLQNTNNITAKYCTLLPLTSFDIEKRKSFLEELIKFIKKYYTEDVNNFLLDLYKNDFITPFEYNKKNKINTKLVDADIKTKKTPANKTKISLETTAEAESINKNTKQKSTNHIDEKLTNDKPGRKTIPKPVKDKVWDLHIGKNKGIGECFVCEKEIDAKHFECGHVKAVAKGGDNNVDNLRPICDSCNKSMGTMDLDEYKTYVTSMLKSKNDKIKIQIDKLTYEELLKLRNLIDVKMNEMKPINKPNYNVI